MPVRLSRDTRATLKILLGGLLQAPEVARRLALLRKFHRKPLREMLRRRRITEPRTVLATVFTVLSGFKQVRVRAADGTQYAITAKTPGVDWTTLREGQEVECIVTTDDLPRIVEAKLLEPRNDCAV